MPTTRFSLPLAGMLLWCVAPAHANEPLFGRHVAPVFYKLGCSAGECHGAFAGKGGFRLSLFASDPADDYRNLRGWFGRRINLHKPEESLLLLKPSGAVEHGGGVRLAPDSPEYRILLEWIRAGARYEPHREPKIVALQVVPGTFTLPVASPAKTLKVVAKLSDGSSEDVTRFAKFETLDAGIATVDAAGQVVPKRAGDVTVLAFYGGQVGFTRVLVPGVLPPGLTFPAENLTDRVDTLLVERLRALNIVPSPRCDDLVFLRRVYLDVIGRLPEPKEVREFLSDGSADKRSKLIDRLLAHPDHAALWAGKLCDMVGADDRFLGNNVYQFHDWFRNKLEKNVPWDQIAYGVVCSTAADERSPQQIIADQKREAEERKKAKEKKAATNPDPNDKPWHAGYANRKTLDVFYANLINQQTVGGKRIIDSKKIALRVAHTFLGVRLECAQCHKHPHDRWSQGDFLSFAAAFSYVEFGADPELKAKKVNLAGTHASAQPAEKFTDPQTGAPLGPRILGGATIDMKPGVDPRKEVWKWMTSPENPYFAHAMVNRVWAHYLGRGLIEPVDDFSMANPPSHPEVLDELARDFMKSKYDLRLLHRRILNTAAYQRDWKTNATNARDERNFSRRLLRRLTAEQAVDAVAQVTGTAAKFAKRYGDVRPGARAVDLALSRAGGDDAYVLQIFGRPLRVQNCDCERSADISLSQSLYLYNDEKLLEKIADPKGRLARLVKEFKDDRKLLEELYLWALTRFPTEAEVERTLRYVREAGSRQEAFEDVLWSLLNRSEFVVNH